MLLSLSSYNLNNWKLETKQLVPRTVNVRVLTVYTLTILSRLKEQQAYFIFSYLL